MDFSKYLGAIGLAELWKIMMAHIDKKIFVGSRAEYENKKSTIPVGALVVIVDEINE